jgi:hypothetical protein
MFACKTMVKPNVLSIKLCVLDEIYMFFLVFIQCLLVSPQFSHEITRFSSLNQPIFVDFSAPWWSYPHGPRWPVPSVTASGAWSRRSRNSSPMPGGGRRRLICHTSSYCCFNRIKMGFCESSCEIMWKHDFESSFDCLVHVYMAILWFFARFLDIRNSIP